MVAKWWSSDSSTFHHRPSAFYVLKYPLFPLTCLLLLVWTLLEKAVTPHSSTLAWKIPWAEEPGRLRSMGLQRVGHDWATSLSLLLSSLKGFPGGSAGKESACNAGDLGSVPGLERSPGEGKHYPLQYSGLENSMDWTVHGVSKSQTQLNNFH